MMTSHRTHRSVSFVDIIPSEKEFFEEYDKYNKTLWFLLIFILRCLTPLCLALQIALFHYPEPVALYIEQFSVYDNNSCDRLFFRPSCYFNRTEDARQYKRQQNYFRNDLILWMTILKGIGIFLGGFIGGIFSDIFGRRMVCFWFSVVWNLLSWSVVFLNNRIAFEALYVAIIACGTVVSGFTYVIFGEIANKRNRHLGAYTLALYPIGEIILHQLSKTLTVWKFLLTFLASVNCLMVLACWYMPESPRWLLTYNKKKAVYDQLNHISGMIYKLDMHSNEKHPNKTSVICKMASCLFLRKLKHFIILIAVSTIASLTFHCAKLRAVLEFDHNHTATWMASVADLMGLLLVFPTYTFIGKRFGLFFIFILIGSQSLVALIIFNISEEIYYNMFGVMFASAATTLNWLYVLDIFPTFLRATTVGSVLCIFGLTSAISTYLADKVAGFYEVRYHLIFLLGSVVGGTVLMLPETANLDLPNYKPFD